MAQDLQKEKVMKTFEVVIKLYGTVNVEDPHGPSEWRGSGCYCIDVPAYCKAYVGVNAESVEEAVQIAMAHEYDDSEMDEVSDSLLLSAEELGGSYYDMKDKGVADVEYGEVEVDYEY